MTSLSEFEKPLYSKVPEHPGVWQPNRYRADLVRSATMSTDSHLISGHRLNNLFYEQPEELPSYNRANAERYDDFVARMKGIDNGRYNCLHEQHFEGKDLGIPTLIQVKLDRDITTYKRHYCGSLPELDSLNVQRMKIQAKKRTVPVPPGWVFKPTSSAAAHRGFDELSALMQASAFFTRRK
ncbi:uncharacterized protein LOC129763353 [Toxorhynchites rutilus septentrionalis]|uniref:uncharacterized protein LOC129763353 n=1 Tax=Toxorhynchites rutilus septentrionalis TaxID=329112 RepID=UPI002478CC66|nr:uncharacterized protein LOC129763353 [Toxorhynchites rutilus septentrionalis]